MSLKKRLDVLLVENGFAESRDRAKSLIIAGRVFGGGKRLDKPGIATDPELPIEVKGKDHPYVSRGGVKLAHALDRLGINVNGKKALDVGASTGGFTDCLLQRGAVSVTALDVGKGQINWRLRNDARVRLIEGFNARKITPENPGGAYNMVTIDVSFISLKLILGSVAKTVAPGGFLIALVKPQFEAKREEVGKGGIIKDGAIHQRVVNEVRDCGKSYDLEPIDEMESPIKGAKGNKEFFVIFKQRS